MTHARPCITADVIVWYQGRHDTHKHIALIKRGKEPFVDHFAFPGGHFEVEVDPSIERTAVRELGEELGLIITEQDLWFFDYFDDPDRDPRGRYVGFVYTYRADSLHNLTPGDDAAGGQWFTEQEIQAMPPLAFDHSRILQQFLQISKDES